jgi:hypothetical protein
LFELLDEVLWSISLIQLPHCGEMFNIPARVAVSPLFAVAKEI